MFTFSTATLTSRDNEIHFDTLRGNNFLPRKSLLSYPALQFSRQAHAKIESLKSLIRMLLIRSALGDILSREEIRRSKEYKSTQEVVTGDRGHRSLATQPCIDGKGWSRTGTLLKISSIPSINGFSHTVCWNIFKDIIL